MSDVIHLYLIIPLCLYTTLFVMPNIEGQCLMNKWTKQSNRYAKRSKSAIDIRFLEIGTDKDHVHFLIQSVPKLSPTQIIRTIKALLQKKSLRNVLMQRKSSGAENFGLTGTMQEVQENMAMKQSLGSTYKIRVEKRSMSSCQYNNRPCSRLDTPQSLLRGGLLYCLVSRQSCRWKNCHLHREVYGLSTFKTQIMSWCLPAHDQTKFL